MQPESYVLFSRRLRGRNTPNGEYAAFCVHRPKSLPIDRPRSWVCSCLWPRSISALLFDGPLALRDKAGPVAVLLLLGFDAGLSVVIEHGQALLRVLQALFLLGGELALLQRLKIAVLVEPVGLEFLLHLFPPPVEMRLALDQFGGAAGQAAALYVEVLQRLSFAVVYGLDVVPVPVDGLSVAALEGRRLLAVLRA